MVISNTTPISNLLHLQLLGLFRDLFDHVVIPLAVHDEVNAFWKDDPMWIDCLASGVIEVQRVESALLVQQLNMSLHAGEAEVIALALERGADVCLIDDRDARLVAISNELSVSGTIGVLLKAKERKFVTEIEPLLRLLRNESYFWLSEPVLRQALVLAME